MELVKGYWTRAFDGQTTPAWTLRDARRPAVRDRRRVLAPRAARRLHRGHVDASAARRAAPRGAGRAGAAARAPRRRRRPGIEIVFRPDPNVLDGRFANNGWLQELPKPLSKVTWDNVAYISPQTAERLGIPVFRVGNGDQTCIEITLQGRTLAHAGVGAARHGRRRRRRALRLRPHARRPRRHRRRRRRVRACARRRRRGSTAAPRSRRPARRYFDRVDAEPLRDGRPQSGARRRRRGVPRAIRRVGRGAGPQPCRRKTLSLYPAASSTRATSGAWRSTSTPAPAAASCVAACVAENNIPVVGKAQVERSREMHWLRVDTYFEGDPGAPDGHLSPAGAVHAVRERAVRGGLPGGGDRAQRRRPERHGLQPLRRHALLLEQLPVQGAPLQLPALLGLHDAGAAWRSAIRTSRSAAAASWRSARTACSASTTRASTPRPRAARLRDGEIKTACEQACPADAIVFGDLNDPDSQVVEAEGAGAQLRAARGSRHAAADDVSGGGAESESGAGVDDRRRGRRSNSWTVLNSRKATSERRCRSSRRDTAIAVDHRQADGDRPDEEHAARVVRRHGRRRSRC